MRTAEIVTTVASSLVALVLGVGVGLVTTFAHRQYPVEIGITIPFGLVAGFAIVAALLVGLRLVFASRIVALAGALGVLATTVVLGLPGPGGSAVVLSDTLGVTWSVGVLLIAALAIGAPFRRRRRTSVA